MSSALLQTCKILYVVLAASWSWYTHHVKRVKVATQNLFLVMAMTEGMAAASKFALLAAFSDSTVPLHLLGTRQVGATERTLTCNQSGKWMREQHLRNTIRQSLFDQDFVNCARLLLLASCSLPVALPTASLGKHLPQFNIG